MSHNPFAQATEATQNLASDVRTGGVPKSALYEATIRAAYLKENNWSSNKVDLVVHAELPSGYEWQGSLTVLIDGSPMAKDKKTGKMELLWSYERAARIIGAATDGKTFEDIYGSIAVKKIELYDFDQKKKVLTDVKMIQDLVGKKLLLGLQRKISNKKARDDAGEWQDLPERKETLELGLSASVTDRRTLAEMNEGIEADKATDADKWEKLNAGKDWDAYKAVGGSAATGVPAAVAAAATTQVHDFGAASS